MVNKTQVRQGKRFGGLFFWILLFFFDYYAFPVAWVPGLHLIHPGKLVGLGVLVALLLNVSSFGDAFLPEVVCMVLLVVQMGLASAFSPVWKGGGINRTLIFSQVVLMFFAIPLAVRTSERLRKLVFVQTASIVAIAFVSLASGALHGGRLTAALSSSDYSNANDLALAIVLTLPFCFYFLFRAQRPLRKAIWAIALLMMCLAVFKTASRGGFLALVVAGGVCLWEYGIKGRRMSLVFAAVIAGLVLFAVAGSKIEDRLAGTFNAQANYESSHGSYEARKDLLIDSLRITAEHPLFGVGVGDFPAASKMWNQTHNVYTTLSAEAGIPALIIFLLIYRRAFSNLREVRRKMPGSDLSHLAASMRASLLAFALAGFFFPDAYDFFPYLMFALTTAAFQVARDQSVEIQEPEAAHHPFPSYAYGIAPRPSAPAR
ncbi:MAG: O-antigen ligase family protein [Terriglobia bacterium]